VVFLTDLEGALVGSLETLVFSAELFLVVNVNELLILKAVDESTVLVLLSSGQGVEGSL
jgi:hypothetical protein